MAASGPLLAADEALTHQIADTFARVVQTDRAWTEKMWAMAAARDGSLSVGVRPGQVRQPQRHGRVRRRVPGHRAVDRAGQPHAVAPKPERTDGRPDHLRDRGAAPAHPHSRSPRQRRACRSASTSRSRARSRRRSRTARSTSAAAATGSMPTSCASTRAVSATRLGRGRGGAGRGRRRRRGSAPATARGACATASASRSTTSRRRRCRRARPRYVLWMPVTMTRPDGRPFTLFVYYQRHHGAGWSTGSAAGGDRASRRSAQGRSATSSRHLAFRRRQPAADRRRRCACVTRRRDRARATGSTPCRRPASTSGPASTAGSRVTYHGEYRGELTSRASTSSECDTVEVAHRIHQHRDCIVASPTRPTGRSASAPCSRSSSARTPRSASPRRLPSPDSNDLGSVIS